MNNNLDFGGVLRRLKWYGEKITEILSVIGNNNDGLIKDVNELKDTVGDEDTGLVKEVNDLNDTVGNANIGLVKEVNDLNNTVGNENSGLIKDVNDLGNTVGNENSGLVKELNDLNDTVGDENSGLVKEVNDLASSISPNNFVKNGELVPTIYGYYAFPGGKTFSANVPVEISVRGSSLADLFYYDNSSGESVSSSVPNGKYYITSISISRENGQPIYDFRYFNSQGTTSKGNLPVLTYSDAISVTIDNNQLYYLSYISTTIISSSQVTFSSGERCRIALTAFKLY